MEKEKIKNIDLKNMTIQDILEMQDKLEKEINSRTNNLVDTLLAVEKIENKYLKIHNFYAQKVKNLKSKNSELKQLEEIGFSAFLYDSSNIALINYKIDDKPNKSYGCVIDIENKNIIFRENMYLESKHLMKIKEILKLI